MTFHTGQVRGLDLRRRQTRLLGAAFPVRRKVRLVVRLVPHSVDQGVEDRWNRDGRGLADLRHPQPALARVQLTPRQAVRDSDATNRPTPASVRTGASLGETTSSR